MNIQIMRFFILVVFILISKFSFSMPNRAYVGAATMVAVIDTTTQYVDHNSPRGQATLYTRSGSMAYPAAQPVLQSNN